MNNSVSQKVVERLSLYRRILKELHHNGTINIFSHQLAEKAGVTAAILRRDIMVVGHLGSPSTGYNVEKLADSIANFFEDLDGDNVALIGVGNLGRAILSYFGRRRPRLNIIASFDVEPDKTNRVIHNCRCYHIDDLEKVLKENNIHIAILTTPAGEAQTICDILVNSGVKGIMNFAPVTLHTPEDVFIENIDLATSLEKVAYFARQNLQEK